MNGCGLRQWALTAALCLAAAGAVAQESGGDLRIRLREWQSRLKAMGGQAVSERQWAELEHGLASLAAAAQSAGEHGIAVEAHVSRARAWGDLRGRPEQAVALLRAVRQEFAAVSPPEIRQAFLLEADMLARQGDADAIRRLMNVYKASPVYDPAPFAYTATPDSAPVVAMVRPRSPQTESPVLLAMQKYVDQAMTSAGSRMPDFVLADIDGLRYSNGSIQGRVVLLDVWVAGSVPWERELPFRLRARERFAAAGFEILGVCQNLDAAGIRRYAAERGMGWPQVEGRMARDLILRLGIPGENGSYLLDRQGRVRGRNLQGSALLEAIARLVAESP